MPSPLAEAFLMGILNGCYETPSKTISRMKEDLSFIKVFVCTIYLPIF